MQPLHAFRRLLSARLLQATIEFHSRMKGELSAFAEQVFHCFFIVCLIVNSRFMNCRVMLCVIVYGDFFRRSLCAVFFCPCRLFLAGFFTCVWQERVLKWLLEASSMLVHAHF